jgi:hypothetical protein
LILAEVESTMPFLYGKMSAFDVDLFNNKSRVRSISGSRNNSIPLEDHTWMEKIPKTKSLSAYEPTSKVYIPSPRRLALESKLKEVMIDSQAIYERGSYFVPDRTTYNVEIRCYHFKGEYQFVEMDSLNNKRRYSRVYKDKSLALQKYRQGRIFWAEDFPKSSRGK